MNRVTKKIFRVQFSVAALLIAILAFASFFSGLMTRHTIERLEATGTYTIRFPRGAQRAAKIVHVEKNEFRLEGAGVLNGIYKRDGGKMTISKPNDKRMVGLVWTRTNRGWRLTQETPNTPTGSSYLGTELTKK